LTRERCVRDAGVERDGRVHDIEGTVFDLGEDLADVEPHHAGADDDEAAEQVANILAAWREMAMSFADTFASHSSGKQLRESLKSSTVQVAANRVLASASVDSRTVVRVSKEVAGHGGGCPAGMHPENGYCAPDTPVGCASAATGWPARVSARR